MDSSLTLLSAHISFLETQLALIHIPLNLYGCFVQPILQLLLPADEFSDSTTVTQKPRLSRRSWAYHHPFVNISVTPIECSIACSRGLAQELFVPVRDALEPSLRNQVSITEEDYVVMQVDGEGLDAGQRVLELTSPLAMAGISIFFITTYFSDYILVPLYSRGLVIQALEDRGFIFERHADAYVNPSHHRKSSSVSSADHPPPKTPPPTSISELQSRTFATLKRNKVFPSVDEDIRLVQCAGRKEDARSSASSNIGATRNTTDKLNLGLVKCFISQPRFLSLTLTDSEPAALLIEKRLLQFFDHANGESVLLGSKEDVLIPIVLDLRQMPLESTGIVCGVAGRLVNSTGGGFAASIEMSYLSTAKAGTVMVAEDQLDRAVDALSGVENGVSNP